MTSVAVVSRGKFHPPPSTERGQYLRLTGSSIEETRHAIRCIGNKLRFKYLPDAT